MGEFLAREVTALMGRLPCQAIEMFVHRVVRGTRPEHDGHSRFLLKVNRGIHRFAAQELVDFADWNVAGRGHDDTPDFSSLQSR